MEFYKGYFPKSLAKGVIFLETVSCNPAIVLSLTLGQRLYHSRIFVSVILSHLP